MSLAQCYTTIIHAGVTGEQTHTFSDKLLAKNRLSFLCVVFSMIYFFYFLLNKQYVPLIAINVGILLFIASILLNHFQKYTLSSGIILFNTNYCILFFSIYLGYSAGIHLYLFTAPLIVLTLFDTNKVSHVAFAMTSYIFSFIIIVLMDKVFKVDFSILNQVQKDTFYLINFICSSVILIALSLYFLYNNNRVNHLLQMKNQQLLFQQNQLKEENNIRKIAEEKAIQSLSEREILLSETHHRVKNNLAVVSALMELQTYFSNDVKLTEVLKESQNRIKSIALLHEKLYENKSLKDVNVALYANELIHFIKQSLADKLKDIKIHTHIDPINLEMSQAMPFGLMLNELITNSFKYAFIGKTKGNIWLNISSKLGNYVLEYKDDGPGFEYNADSTNKSLGLNLIESFSIQLNGTFEYKHIKEYLVFEFTFPINNV